MIISELLLLLTHTAQRYRKLWVKNMDETSGIFMLSTAVRMISILAETWDGMRNRRIYVALILLIFPVKTIKSFQSSLRWMAVAFLDSLYYYNRLRGISSPLSNVMLKENRSSSKWMRWSCVVFHKCSTISFAVVQAANLGVHPRSVIVKSSISHFKKSFSV